MKKFIAAARGGPRSSEDDSVYRQRIYLRDPIAKVARDGVSPWRVPGVMINYAE